MEIQDYMEPEVGIAIAVTAAIASPEVRKVVRQGAVYGLAGLLMAGDAVMSFTKAIGRGAQQAAATVSDEVAGVAHDASETVHPDAEESTPAEHAGEPESKAHRRPAGKRSEAPADA